MDLLRNRLLGERRRALSTMHRSWRDFQPFEDTRASHCTLQGISNQRVAANADVEISVRDHRTR